MTSAKDWPPKDAVLRPAGRRILAAIGRVLVTGMVVGIAYFAARPLIQAAVATFLASTEIVFSFVWADLRHRTNDARAPPAGGRMAVGRIRASPGRKARRARHVAVPPDLAGQPPPPARDAPRAVLRLEEDFVDGRLNPGM